MADPKGAVMIGGSEPPSGGGNFSGGPSIPSVISTAKSGLDGVLAALNDIDRKMDAIVSKAQNFGGSMGSSVGGLQGNSFGSMTAANGMPVRGMTSPWQPNTTAQGGGVSGGTPGGGGQPAFGLKAAFSGAVTAAGAAGIGMVGMSANQAATGAYGQSVSLQRFGSSAGQGFNGGGAQFQQLKSQFSGGYTGVTDLFDATNAMFNMGWGPSVLNAGVAQGMAQFAQNTNQSLSQTQQTMAATISNPQTLIKARAFGINPLTPSGGPQNLSQTVNQVLQATWGGSAPSRSAVNSALSPYGNLRQNLQNLGMNNEQISNLQPSIEDWASSGGGAFSTSGANPLGVSGRDKAAGQATMAAAQFDSLTKKMQAMNKVAADLDNNLGSHSGLMNFLGGLKGIIGGGTTNMNGTTSLMGSAVKDVGQGLILKHILGGGKSLLGGARGSAGDADGLLGGIGSKLGGVGDGLLGIGGDAASATGIGAVLTAIFMSGKQETGMGNIDVGMGGAAGAAKMRRYENAHGGLTPGQGGGMGLGANTSNGTSSASPVGSGSSSGVIAFAEKQIGTPYSWGGGGTNGPSRGIDQGSDTVGFDCSGFVQYVFAHFGVMLPRTTQQQVKCGTPVKPADVMPGDLVFFNEADGPNGHVGIALSATRFINAPHTGTSVQIDNYDVKGCSNIRRVINSSSSGATVLSPNSNVLTGLIAGSQASAMAAANILGMNGVGSSGGGVSVGQGGLGQSSGGGGGGNASVGSTNVSGSLTPTSFATDLLKAIGRPTSKSNVAAVSAWEAQEGGNWHNDAHYNPLNTTQPMPGYHTVGTQGDIGSYNSWSQGLDATAITLTNGHYANILAAMNGGSAQSVANAVANSPWGTGHFNVPSYAKGAWKIQKDELANVHEGEMVLPKKIAAAVRGGGSGNTVVINASFAEATEAQARRLIAMVEEHFEEMDHLDRMANA